MQTSGKPKGTSQNFLFESGTARSAIKLRAFLTPSKQSNFTIQQVVLSRRKRDGSGRGDVVTCQHRLRNLTSEIFFVAVIGLQRDSRVLISGVVPNLS